MHPRDTDVTPYHYYAQSLLNDDVIIEFHIDTFGYYKLISDYIDIKIMKPYKIKIC